MGMMLEPPSLAFFEGKMTLSKESPSKESSY
jgi:hypothetical protein